jgi:hypothetical protein
MSSLVAAALQRLRRRGFRDEPILGDDRAVELVCFLRDTDHGWHEVVLVYGEHAARAYRMRRRAGASDDPLRCDPAGVHRLIPLADVSSVVTAVLSWPADESSSDGEASR